MATKTPIKAPLPMTGSDIVGRGIYLRPRQPFELKDVLFKRDSSWPYYSIETERTYSVPEGLEVNDSPPMPAEQALNQTVIEESWERFDKQFSLDASLAAGNNLFTVDVNTSQGKQLHSEQNAYYASRSSFIPLWTIYLPNIQGFSENTFAIDIPTPFKHAHRRQYDKFFDRYGTHYVKRAWAGGKAVLVFSIAKSSQMTKQEIQAGIKASFTGFGESSANQKLAQSKEKLQSNSECTVFGKGGDELKLAALSSLDEAAYNAWLATIKQNPQVIEIEVAGIWTLVSDAEKAKALQEAYMEATIFTAISAIFSIDRKIYFLKEDKYFYYDTEKRDSYKPQPIAEKWPMLSQLGFESIDAAFTGRYLVSVSGENLSRKFFLFKRDQYIRLDMDAGNIDEGYPKSIKEGWPGVTFDRIDAALNAGPDALYFFRGNHYVRYNMLEHRVDAGYPDLINKRWAGLIFDRIDAAIYWRNGKVYFFKDDQYIRYDMTTYQADPGYPKFIIGNYVEDWKFLG